jgi:hypothetical protein
MNKLAVILVAIATTFVGTTALGQEGSQKSSLAERAATKVNERCTSIGFDQQLYDQATQVGDPKAADVAMGVSFRPDVFDRLVRSGTSVPAANEVATTKNYTDKSPFCIEFRRQLNRTIIEIGE